MLAVDAGELVVLALWALGVACAVHATTGASVPYRLLVVLRAALVPVLGTLGAVALAVSRLLRRRRAGAGATSA